MCLEVVTKTGLDEEGQGWKVFRFDKNIGMLSGSDVHNNQIPVARWFHKDECKVPDVSGFMVVPEYPLGFHIFKKKADAVAWLMGSYSEVVVHIKYRHGHTQGLQDMGVANKSAFVIVADEIYVIPDEKYYSEKEK